MQMMRTADSRWPESLQQQQATAQWNEILKTRAQRSTTATGAGQGHGAGRGNALAGLA
ncbi:hypothetical protein [Salmonella enterica]|uniref:hypothetical protein n=1 Tax=Salmonella enterica TaxID=28901 RepID=UPI0003A4E40F|nr:hypothetical protein [Salmonella enterica]